jgi:hypothetical protein
MSINRVTVCEQRLATKRDHPTGRSVAGRSIKWSSRLITSKPLWRISSSAVEAAIWYCCIWIWVLGSNGAVMERVQSKRMRNMVSQQMTHGI